MDWRLEKAIGGSGRAIRTMGLENLTRRSLTFTPVKALYSEVVRIFETGV